MKRFDLRRLRPALTMLAFLLAFFCAPSAVRSFPWSIDMFRRPPVQPLAIAPRVMPSGTLPISGGHDPITREQAAISLHNPLTPTAAHLEHGRQLYQNICAPCHGPRGKGDGPVASLLAKPPDDLTSPDSARRSDGFLYAEIRDGGGAMPSYADAMSADERWEVVLFQRSLQQKTAAK